MSLTLPIWGWVLCGVGISTSLVIAYGCGLANGERLGIDWMKREAVRVGVAKACDFDGGWRWWSRYELAEKLKVWST